MRVQWLSASIVGILGAFLLSSSAEATELANWRFESRTNRLTFTTDQGVQPRAQLLFNPTRIVIDLPGTSLGNVNRTQTVGGAIREVRAGQLDAQTTRIVIELTPGFTIDPEQVLVRGATPTQWTVQLPTPQRTETAETPGQTPPGATPPGATTPPGQTPASISRLEAIQITGDGLFLRTGGPTPQVRVRRERGRNPRLIFELENTLPSPQLTQRELNVNRYGVRQARVTTEQGDRPSIRVTLDLTREDFDWRVVPSGFGGIVLLPPAGAIARPGQPTPNPNPPTTPPTATLATVQAIELSGDRRRILVRTDRPVRYTSGWDRNSNAYRITLEGTQLPTQVPGPALDSRSPVQSIRLRQETSDTVVVFVQPVRGVRIGELAQTNGETLSLTLRGTPVSGGRPPTTSFPPGELPRVDGRMVVVIDPGHGGIDPGAIGIGGLREVDIVDDVVRELTTILERQGVQVVLTRRGNVTVDLEPRVQVGERANADYFISIHANAISLSRPDVNGAETYYFTERSQGLAESIQNSILEATGMNDRGVKRARFYVIRSNSMPAVLVETGFVTGVDDAPRLRDPAFRRLMAEAIARGILQFAQQR